MLNLIVDDDESIARVVGSYLNKPDYDVLSAYDMHTALHILQKQAIDLLILDIMLPDGDGWRIVDAIRTDNRLLALS